MSASPVSPSPLSAHPLWRFRYLLPALSAAFLLWNLNYAPVWNPDEGRYISASLEMFAPLDGSTPDWIVPHLNTIPRLNKPPLVYWCAAGLFKFFGPSEATARLVPALAAIGVLLVLWRMGTIMFGEKTGIFAAVVWVSCLLPFVLARILSTDMLLAFSTALTLLGIYQIAVAQNKWPAGAIALAGIGSGLALLAKGPVGLLLPLSILAVWLVLVSVREPESPKKRGYLGRFVWPVFISTLIAAALTAPWCIAIGRSHPEFLRNFLAGENLARFTGSTAYHQASPFLYYVPVLIVGLLPWTAFLWPALRKLCVGFSLRKTSIAAEEDFAGETDLPTAFSQTNARLFLWLWAIAVILLFSISRTKLIPYILPAFPPLALLIAEALTGANARLNEKALRQANKATIALLIFLALTLGAAFFSSKLLADKIVPRADSTPFIALLCLVLISGAVGLSSAQRAVEFSSFRRRVGSTLVATGAVLFLTLIGFMGRFALYEDASPMMTALIPFLRPGDTVVQFKTFQPSIMFYYRAPSTIVDFVNTSGLDEGQFQSSLLFRKDHAVIQKLFKTRRRVFVLTRWKHARWRTLPKLFVIGGNNDFRLLSNRPAPPGFRYDFIAPRKRNRKLPPACLNFSPDC